MRRKAFNSEALAQLAAGADAWAKAYIAVTEALIKQGVPEPDARREAAMAANMAAMRPDDSTPGDEWMP